MEFNLEYPYKLHILRGRDSAGDNTSRGYLDRCADRNVHRRKILQYLPETSKTLGVIDL